MATDLQSPFVAAQGLFRVPQFVEVLRYCSYPMVANLIVFVMKNDSKTNGRHLIFRPYVVRNGKVIYPKNGRMLAFWVEDQSQSSICRRQLQLPPFYFCSYNSQDFLRSPTLICFFLQQKRNFFISFFLYMQVLHLSAIFSSFYPLPVAKERVASCSLTSTNFPFLS